MTSQKPIKADKNIDLANIIIQLKRRYAAVMKLKNIYACIASAHPPCDDAYEATSKKISDGNQKPKRPAFRPKWQPVSKSPKTRSKHEGNAPGLTLAITQGKELSEGTSPTRNSPSHQKSLLDQTPLSGSLPSPLKPSNPQTDLFSSSTNSWMSFDDENTFTSVFQSTSHPHYDQVADDDDDDETEGNYTTDNNVLSVTSLEWNSSSDSSSDKKWNSHAAFQNTEVEQESIRAINALKLQSKYESARRNDDNRVFEDLKNEAIVKYGFCGFSSTTKSSDPTPLKYVDTSSRVSSEPLFSSSFAVKNTSEQQPLSSSTETRFCVDDSALDARINALTLDNAPKTRSSSIQDAAPPLIPPREPVRKGRSNMYMRQHSTPLPATATLVVKPTTASLSTSTSFKSSSKAVRNSATVLPVTTSVFSALPSSMTHSTPVILPVMKNGKQDSHTHYYILPEEKAKKSPTSSTPYDPLQSIARPTPSARVLPMMRTTGGPPPPRPPPPTKTSPSSSFELSLSSSTIESSPSSNSSNKPTAAGGNTRSQSPPQQLTSSTSSTLLSSSFSHSRYNPRYEDMGRGQKVVAVQSEVFGVTDEECLSALKMNQWNVPNTIRYLKVEQLFRLGVASHERCNKILRAHNWNLQTASQFIVDHHQTNNL